MPALAALLLGCNALFGGAPWGPERLGTDVDDEACATCHADVADRLAGTPHDRAGLACAQCHRGDGHPDFAEPLDDGTCGGCHLPEYQQVARSPHARRAVEVACVACHFDDHSLSATSARADVLCETCHGEREAHVPRLAAGGVRCFQCHMRRGTTIVGQPLSSHEFAAPEGARR